MLTRLSRAMLAAVCLVGVSCPPSAVAQTPLPATAPEARLIAGPAVNRDAGGYRITFAVSAPTDVEVAIVDARGNVVRHLAAGLLDPDAATEEGSPLKHDSLAQAIVWDGKDDAGAAAGGGPFSARVRVGAGFQFDRAIRADRAAGPGGPEWVGVIIALAADANGVYVMDCGDYPARSSPRIVRLAGQRGQPGQPGGRTRTLMPWPAAVATQLDRPPDEQPDRMKDLWLRTASGRLIPRVHHSFQCLYPQMAGATGPGMCLAGDRLVFINNYADIYTKEPPRLLRLMADDGSIPPRGFLGSTLQPDAMSGTAVHIAASPDGKTVYATGLVGRGKWKRDPQNVVVAVERDLPADPRLEARSFSPATVLIGEPYKAAKDPTHLANPVGIATDSQGRIYVADHDNDRVVQFDAAGKFLASLDVPAPGPLAIDPANGTLFVASGTDEQFRGGKLLRFKSIAGEPAGELALPDKCRTMLAYRPGQPGELYLAVAFEDHSLLSCIPDVQPLAGTIVARTPTGAEDVGLVRPMYVSADPADRFVLVRDWACQAMLRYVAPAAPDGAPGALTRFAPAADAAIARDGRVYAFTGGYAEPGKLTCHDRDGNAVPFAEGDKQTSVAGTLRGGHMRGVRGLAVAPNGDLYVLHFRGYQDKDKGLPAWDAVVLDIFGPDGRLKKAGLLTLSSGAGGVRVDRDGNIYVAEHLLPADHRLLDEFKPAGPLGLRVYRDIYGSIVKFGPEGGGTVFYAVPPTSKPDGLPAVSSNWNSGNYIGQFRVTGQVTRIIPGVSPVGAGPRGMGCTCYTGRFDLDSFGRLFVPDAARFSVRVLDSAGNPIARFGQYGNADDRGGIRFAWPAYVAVSDKAVYVSDPVNRQLVRVTASWQAEQTVPLP